MSIVDKDMGYNRILRELDKIDGSNVDIGFFPESVYPDGTPIAAVAAANTFGTDTIPERPFMQNTLDNNEKKHLAIIRESRDDMFLGKTDGKKGMIKLGEEVRDDMVKEIVDLRDPANADATVEGKGSSNPLVDTGQMMNNVKFKVKQ